MPTCWCCKSASPSLSGLSVRESAGEVPLELKIKKKTQSRTTSTKPGREAIDACTTGNFVNNDLTTAFHSVFDFPSVVQMNRGQMAGSSHNCGSGQTMPVNFYGMSSRKRINVVNKKTTKTYLYLSTAACASINVDNKESGEGRLPEGITGAGSGTADPPLPVTWKSWRNTMVCWRFSWTFSSKCSLILRLHFILRTMKQNGLDPSLWGEGSWERAGLRTGSTLILLETQSPSCIYVSKRIKECWLDFIGKYYEFEFWKVEWWLILLRWHKKMAPFGIVNAGLPLRNKSYLPLPVGDIGIPLTWLEIGKRTGVSLTGPYGSSNTFSNFVTYKLSYFGHYCFKFKLDIGTFNQYLQRDLLFSEPRIAAHWHLTRVTAPNPWSSDEF